MAKPTEADLSSLRTWLVNDKGGHRFLDGIEGLTYSHPDMESDLVAISDRQRDRDLFSVWLSDSFVRLLYRHLPAMFKVSESANWRRTYFRPDLALILLERLVWRGSIVLT